METKKRRKKLYEILKETNDPIKGNELAKKFKISRQVIVQDIAVLRAQGCNILATPQGYIVLNKSNGKILETIVCKHQGYNEIKDELNAVVECGGEIVDVIVEHPIYGEIKGNLMIKTKLEVEKFMKKVISLKAEPLAKLCDGIHIHTISADEKETIDKVKDELRKKGFLIED